MTMVRYRSLFSQLVGFFHFPSLLPTPSGEKPSRNQRQTGLPHWKTSASQILYPESNNDNNAGLPRYNGLD
jgi:hypothetical protein